MNKKILYIILVLIVFTSASMVAVHYSNKINPRSQTVSVVTDTTENIKTSNNSEPETRIPFDYSYFATNPNLGTDPTYTSPDGTKIVSFKISKDPEDFGGQVPTSIVSVNGTVAGKITGNAIFLNSFSPSNKYFGVEGRSTCGAGCEDIALYLINLDNPAVIHVPFPQKGTDYSGNLTQYVDKQAQPFIESYSWEGSSMIAVTFFFVGTDISNGKTYRISPKQIWLYNITTSKYSLASTVPE